MGADRLRKYIQEILSPPGIIINGDKPWDIRVRNEEFYRRVARDGSLGLGESYMDGWWDCESLDSFFSRLMPSEAEEKVGKNWRLLLHALKPVLLNPGKRAKAFEIGERHYDLGNELYRSMLDRRMVYSCAYWKNAGNLDDAQEAKLELICRKLALGRGDKVLDVGCGWGSFAKYAAEKFGAEVTGITVSREQAVLATELCRGLPVQINLQDYRDVDERFDHVVSVGMFEHVGYRNYRTYMKTVRRCLGEDGLFLLHTIGNSVSQKCVDPWFDKYIFPNSFIPSIKQITAAAEGLFVIEDIHNFGHYYDPTLMSWFRNFDSNWNRLKARYDDRFYRMWKYYLLSSAGTFRSRSLQVWQIVLSKKGIRGGYAALR